MQIVTLAERPDLAAPMWDMPNGWPEYMQHDPFGDVFFARLPEVFPEWQLVALNGDGEVVGKVNAIPFAWAGTDADLPDRGWDAVMERGFADRRRGVAPTAVSLLEARLAPTHLGAGHSRRLLDAAADNVRRHGLQDLFGPVRPTEKHRLPLLPMSEYVAMSRDDGLPVDPWLRVHARRGARVVKLCPASMTIPGSLDDWRRWTGLPFDVSGQQVVPFACNPVHVVVEQDHAVYVEPNVWMHHDLRGGAASSTA